jgi:hypothetical protein
MSARVIFALIVFMGLNVGGSFAGDMQKNPAEQEFCRLDKNNDREITFEEFSACEFYKLERVRRLPFQELKDQTKDGKVEMSDDDLKAYLFKKADRNKSGKIDRKEWEEFYNSLIEPGGGISQERLDGR